MEGAGRRARDEIAAGNRLVVIAALVWGADGVEHIATRARAGKNRARGVEAGERGAIQRETLALGDDGFFPSETQPAQVFEHRGDEIEAEADRIEVVVAQ